ncbi:hypothetical protein [Hymenobacter coccineus]|uniref:hypothetical protein n=1 Tax=Hymenobacter coccineus TaxID=1908235 RepID=UPI000F7738E5|nr:hypothetical protein [Hymenobacter coccineus]
MTFRSFYLVALTVAAFSVSACKKDEPAPTTGNLNLTVTYDSIYVGYSLFTEEGWLIRTTTGTGSALRSGPFTGSPPPITNTRLKTTVILNGLNPGNYEFVVNASTAQSVQVTAGQTKFYTFDL